MNEQLRTADTEEAFQGVGHTGREALNVEQSKHSVAALDGFFMRLPPESAKGAPFGVESILKHGQQKTEHARSARGSVFHVAS